MYSPTLWYEVTTFKCKVTCSVSPLLPGLRDKVPPPNAVEPRAPRWLEERHQAFPRANVRPEVPAASPTFGLLIPCPSLLYIADATSEWSAVSSNPVVFLCLLVYNIMLKLSSISESLTLL
jgi:hypothetical protein